MKKNITLIAFCGLFAVATNAQVNPSTAPDNLVAGPIQNTGLAIAPDFSWNAVVYDNSAGNYVIDWRDPITGASIYQTAQRGYNPDVAYFSNPDNVNVAYEEAGLVWVDDYYLTGGTPLYVLGANNPVSTGINPNIDMNSSGQGVLTWQDAGGVWMCSFQIGPFIAGPIVPVAAGAHPDVALLDNNQEVVITFHNGGNLVIQSYDFPLLTGGILSPTSPTMTFTPGGLGYSYPRIQSNRNSSFGPPELFTVVVQDNMGGGFFDVVAHFFAAPGLPIISNLVNAGVSCAPSFPLPVVAYDRDEVHVAWSQNYSCSAIPAPPVRRDILMVQYDHGGAHAPGSTTPVPGTFQEVNNTVANFTFSSTSLNTEYDGDYLITSTNYCEGVAFNDPTELYWKPRNTAIPFFREAGPTVTDVKVGKGVTDDFITVEVVTEDLAITPNDLEIEFTLYDQSGRVVALPEFTQEGMNFRIDASTLEHGIYLLHYTLNGETKAERIPHFRN